MKAHNDFRKYKVFRRTYWATTTARIIRPYWTWDNKIEGYILELKSGVQISLTVKHLKEAR